MCFPERSPDYGHIALSEQFQTISFLPHSNPHQLDAGRTEHSENPQILPHQYLTIQDFFKRLAFQVFVSVKYFI